MSAVKNPPSERLSEAALRQSEKFKRCYLWLEKSMPADFFDEIDPDNLMLVTHSLMGFETQDTFSATHLKNGALVVTLDSADADLRILKEYALKGIQNYRTFVSNDSPPFIKQKEKIRVALLHFTGAEAEPSEGLPPELKARVQKLNPSVTDAELNLLSRSLGARFLRSLHLDRLTVAFDMFFRAQKRDHCQYEVYYNDSGVPSMHIILAWRNTPKHNFLYLLARTVHRHGLVMRGVSAAYLNTAKQQNTLVMALGLHGADGREVWEVADIPDFLRELITVKYFSRFDLTEEKLVRPGVVSGVKGNLLRAMTGFIHQALVPLDPNIYSVEHIEWDLCRLPEITRKICDAFSYKFDPNSLNTHEYERLSAEVAEEIRKLDTGHVENDLRRKNVLTQALNFVAFTLKTNFYLYNYSALAFRLDPAYLDAIPFDRAAHYPELPYGIFYIKGMHFFGFHIRFKDLSRGGLRTVFPEYSERMQYECDHIFSECYNLAYTQQKKNKDIPEGGAKGVIFLEPHKPLEVELQVLEKELEALEIPVEIISDRLKSFRRIQQKETLYQAQRAYIINLMSLINSDDEGRLKMRHIVDNYRRPEYLYLGPDENMHPEMLTWIAEYAKMKGYRPGASFITSKPESGINHKEYGVTSSGVNVYMEETLRYLGIDPSKQPFTVKMSGGPDGDVAGNQILNLYRLYPRTAKLVALTDGTGTIHEPAGLDLTALAELFRLGEGIHKYPPERLSEGAFLVDKLKKRSQTAYIQQTLCLRKVNGALQEEWLGGSEVNHLLRHNLHSTPADIFIPAGGRPRTLNQSNWTDFLDSRGTPTARAIVEGANLYLDDRARSELEAKGTLIIKDSSANKAGVICSSYEALVGLVLSEEEFKSVKETLVAEILEIVKSFARKEAHLLLSTHTATGEPLTAISERISHRINKFTYEILDYLEQKSLPLDSAHPLIQTYLSHCPPTLAKNWQKALLDRVPEQHIKAIISCRLASQIVYNKGLSWEPTIVDALPSLASLEIKQSQS